jgi:hypothetical protein
MRPLGQAAAAAFFVFLTGAAAVPKDGQAMIATIARDKTLPNFTFHADVAVAMHHFPWLHFHLIGDGQYRRHGRYVVHFTQMPFFAKNVHDIDLSLLNPALWRKEYVVSERGISGQDTVFDLQARHDPSLKSAEVALNENGPDWVDATYADGTHIHMTVTATESGFLLPTKLDCAIDVPHMPLSATADFTDYRFGHSIAVTDPSSRLPRHR